MSKTRKSDARPGVLAPVLKSLGGWFERQKRILPWRESPSKYRVWISEIMLQQTQVVTVVPYFERFIAKFPTVEALAAASEEEVMQSWAGLGYYSRARNLHRAARLIVEKGFPRDREEWLRIPGVGDYTAGAILSIAQNEVEPILDGNVERVLSRFYCVDRAKGDASYKDELWAISERWVREGSDAGVKPSVLNQALMELGAMICTPKKPRCFQCPVSDACRAKKKGVQETYPPKKAPKKWIAVREELHCVLDDQDRALVRFREKGEWRAGLWDLLTTEEWEALGKRGHRELGKVETRHIVTRHKITRLTRVWRMKSGALRAAESAKKAGRDGDAGAPQLRWISLDEPSVPVGSALKKTWAAIRSQVEAAD